MVVPVSLLLVLICAGTALFHAYKASKGVLAAGTGTAEMQRIASAIQEGAQAYLSRQYRTIAIVGAVVAVLYLCFGGLDEDLSGGMRVMVLLAIALVCVGVIGLGVVESREDDELRRARQAASNYRYAKSWLALALPVAYCLLDAAGTFADSRVLTRLDPDAANCAYELTFLFAAAVSFVYVKFIRHDRFLPKREGPKYVGALFETAGQFAYIYAIADEDHVMYAAPIISAYCAASVLWSRIFLREKLSWRHYLMLLLIVVGIVLIGILDL